MPIQAPCQHQTGKPARHGPGRPGPDPACRRGSRTVYLRSWYPDPALRRRPSFPLERSAWSLASMGHGAGRHAAGAVLPGRWGPVRAPGGGAACRLPQGPGPGRPGGAGVEQVPPGACHHRFQPSERARRGRRGRPAERLEPLPLRGCRPHPPGKRRALPGLLRLLHHRRGRSHRRCRPRGGHRPVRRLPSRASGEGGRAGNGAAPADPRGSPALHRRKVPAGGGGGGAHPPPCRRVPGRGAPSSPRSPWTRPTVPRPLPSCW